MSFTIIIPARYGSSRLPGKPLLEINGRPMIEHVYRRAESSEAQRVLVATDDERIKQAVESFGGEACMTSADHVSGTDRLQEVVSLLGLGSDEIVVNVQGDEPLIPANVINQVAGNLAKNTGASCATLSEPVTSMNDCLNPNVVQVVSDVNGYALYFSRAPIPWDRDNYSEINNDTLVARNSYRHIGIYAYRVGLLHEFVSWKPSGLELTEKLEQLRILENGRGIHVEPACELVPGGVDTSADLQRLNTLLTTQEE